MKDLIDRKLNELLELDVRGKEYRQWLEDSNAWSWLYSMFVASGFDVSRGSVADMVCGKIREDGSLRCYRMVQGFKDMHSDMKQEMSMQSLPNSKLFWRWADYILPDVQLRNNNRVVFEMGFIPCHFNSIADNMDAAFKKYATSEKDLKAAVTLFLELIKVYPIGEDSVLACGMVLSYCLEMMKYPLPELPVGESEFNKLCGEYLDGGNMNPFFEMMERAVYNRLDIVVNAALQVSDD